MITPGKLRGITQPTIMLRMETPVEPAPDEPKGDTENGKVFTSGTYVLAQYVGNGRLLLVPLDSRDGHGSHVVMASALNSTASIVEGRDISDALNKASA